MSGNPNDGNGEPKAEPVYEIKIRFFPERNFVAVEGPMQQQTLFLGMLESAKLILFQSTGVKPETPLIHLPHLGRAPRGGN